MLSKTLTFSPGIVNILTYGLHGKSAFPPPPPEIGANLARLAFFVSDDSGGEDPGYTRNKLPVQR